MPDLATIIGSWPATVNRCIITGSRKWPSDDKLLPDIIGQLFDLYSRAILVVGYDPKTRQPAGVDRIAYTLWWTLGGKVEPHPAAWNGPLKRGAGFARNQEMADSGADLCLAFVLNESPGATHCAERCEAADIPTIRFSEPSRA